jgi:hypothetical protein
VQRLWDLENFSVGYPPDYFQFYFDKLAQWEKLGDFQVCDPTAKLAKRSDYDVSRRLIDYLMDGTGIQGETKGFISNNLAAMAGYRLKWTLPARILKIEPEQWLEDAPLPGTNPDDFLFWYCPTYWDVDEENTGCSLEVNPMDGAPQTFRHRAGYRAVMTHGIPHVLTAMGPRANKPYYCLYGQLQAAE